MKRFVPVLIAALAGGLMFFPAVPTPAQEASSPAPVEASPAPAEALPEALPEAVEAPPAPAEASPPPPEVPPVPAEAPPAPAEAPPTPVSSPPAPPAVLLIPTPTPEEIVSLDEILSGRYSFRFVDEDVQLVLRGLARAYRFNITISPEVTGKVTANFRNVRLRDVIDNILKDFGYGYREAGDILRVTTLEKLKMEDENEAVRKQAQAMRLEAERKQQEAELAKEPQVIRVFLFKYVDANNVKEAIKPLLTQLSPTQPAGSAVVLETKQFTGFAFENITTYGAKLAADEAREFVRSNTMIVKDKESVVAQIARVVEEIDRRPNQVMIDAKIIEVPVNQDFRLGLDWSGTLNQLQIGVTDAQIGLEKSYERVRTSTDSATHAWGSEWEDKRTDTRTVSDQVSSESLRRDSSGIDYPEVGPFVDNEDTVSNSRKFSDLALGVDALTARDYDNYINSISSQIESIASSGNLASMILSATDFNVLLSAMESDSDIAILSNPRIIVHENYAANIFVGQRYPILKTEFDAAGGASAGAVGGTSVEEWREIGITLKVIPQVRRNREGLTAVNMIVHPAVSDINGYALAYSPTGQAFQSSYPIISIREADTNVTIADGNTLVIGGLIESYTADEVTKIPLLGDIPILGYLFREDHQATRKNNLLIFITARVVNEQELSPYEKLMLEKSTPEALQDVIYVPDTEVRPYLYRNLDEPGLQAAAAGEGEGGEKEEAAAKEPLSPRSGREPGEAEGKGKLTKARERSPKP